jgi:hypothetical protein
MKKKDTRGYTHEDWGRERFKNRLLLAGITAVVALVYYLLSKIF